MYSLLKLAGMNLLEIGLQIRIENSAEMGIFEKLSEMKDIEALKLAGMNRLEIGLH